MTSFLYSIMGFVLALGILVTIHEFGHFWVARKVGVKVIKFSVGFGSPLWKRKGKDGVEYLLGVVPLGGYVKMLDEREGEVQEKDRPFAFNRQPLLSRTAIVFAGPLSNFLFAIAAYALVALIGVEDIRPIVGRVVEGSPAATSGIVKGDEVVAINGRSNSSWSENRLFLFDQVFSGSDIELTVRHQDGRNSQHYISAPGGTDDELTPDVLESVVGIYSYIPPLPPVIGGVMEGSPAALAGLKLDDRVISVDGIAVEEWMEVVNYISQRPSTPIELMLLFDSSERIVEVTPRAVAVEGEVIGQIGAYLKPVPFPEELKVKIQLGLGEALLKGVESTWGMSTLTLKVLGKIITFQTSTDSLSGPISIAQYAGQTAQLGISEFILFLAIISVSLGVLNLLPIPLLDGGHLFYFLVEFITRRPVSKQFMIIGQQIGIFVLVMLMSVAVYNDIVRLSS